jgi:hypothetical protein
VDLVEGWYAEVEDVVGIREDVVVDHVPEFEGEGYELLPHVRRFYVGIKSLGLYNIEVRFESMYRGLGCVYPGLAESECVELDIRIKERRLILVILRPKSHREAYKLLSQLI